MSENNLNLNLLPSRAKFQAVKILWKSRMSKLMMVIAGIWVVTAMVVLVLTFIAQMQVRQLQQKQDQANSAYSSLSDTVVNSQRLKYQAKLVGQVLAGRFEYSKAFKEAQTFFPDGVTMLKFDLNGRDGITLSGTTSGQNMDLVEKLIKDINDGNSDEYKSAKIDALSWTKGSWNFTVEVALK